MRAAGDSARRRAEARRIPNTHPSLSLDQYAGTYADSLVGDVVVSLENGKLRLRSSSTHAGTLEHWEYDTFRLRWDNAWEGTRVRDLHDRPRRRAESSRLRGRDVASRRATAGQRPALTNDPRGGAFVRAAASHACQVVRCRLSHSAIDSVCMCVFAHLDRHCVEVALHRATSAEQHAMTHPIQTTIDFQDSEPFRFECASCGTLHEGIPSFGWDFPAQYLAVPDGERARRVVLSDDACVIDDEWFFIRGCLEIPVHGYQEPLNYGVWLSLSRDSFTPLFGHLR